MQPHAPVSAALTAVIPWGDAKVMTYVLNQQGHRLARAGFIQLERRPRQPEYHISLLAPALDTPSGHPAIWEKLLSYTIQEAARHRIERIYVDVPDQPLPVSSFAHVGFIAYTRQTIWRLRLQNLASVEGYDEATIRPATDVDAWSLQRLYARVTPVPVQQAECGQRLNAANSPILCAEGQGCRRYVLVEDGDVTGCLHTVQGRRGAWLRLWVDMSENDGRRLRRLIGFGLKTTWTDAARAPVYIGVSDYHGGLSSVLDEFGFAPFTDRAKMVKHVLAWVKEGVPASLPLLESVGEVATSTYVVDPWTLNEPLPVRRNSVTDGARRMQEAELLQVTQVSE